MTPERFKEVRDLFEAVSERPEALAWLSHACSGDRQLYAEVEDLLLADGLAKKGFELTSRVLSTVSESGAVLPSFDGRRVGQYDIVRELGRGGMGAVYLATRADNVFSKRVAIKIVRPERSDADLLRRFHQEREIVAKLDHPNIARLLDGGTTDEGLPYSVMEYVDGQRIDSYCDERRLTVTDRLTLVRTVCTAVQYAHQNLVVHRDLKPSNILVTPDGAVKLLDFGIAKVLGVDGEDTLSNTTLGPRLLTLSYASPEQVKGERITTSSDVYSLGVVLYELLTGRLPYITARPLSYQMAEAICEQEPIVPSAMVLRPFEDGGESVDDVGLTLEQVGAVREGTPARLARRLTDELDNITMMALRKEPDRRYSSIEQFGEDLHRHLSGLPVLAQHDTFPYRARKFVLRHRLGVAAAAMIVMSMVGAIAVTSWQMSVARAERRRAEYQATEARLQSQRAERQTTDAEFYRTRAEQQAELARQQLSIADQRTREADAQRREAAFEREKAERRAKDVRAISAALLEVNANLPDFSDSEQAGKSAMGTVERILSALLSEGFSDQFLSNDVAVTREVVKKYEERAATVIRTCPATWEYNSDHPEEYECGLDRKNSVAGSSAYIKSRHSRAQGHAELWQSVEVEPYRGRRIRVSASLRSVAVEGTAGIFFRVTDEDGNSFGNRRVLSLRGTNDWSDSAVVFDVPDDGAQIAMGFQLRGSGAVWADNFSVEVVDASVPLTPTLPRGPAALSFGPR